MGDKELFQVGPVGSDMRLILSVTVLENHWEVLSWSGPALVPLGKVAVVMGRCED